MKRRALARLKDLRSDLTALGGSTEPLPASQTKFLERTSAIAALIQSAATVMALIVGAVWTYYLFDPLAELNPNLSLTQTVESRDVTPEATYLLVNVALKNTSKRVLHISCAEITVNRVSPIIAGQLPEVAKKSSRLMGESVDLPTVQYGKISFPAETFVEPQGELQQPWNLIITRRVNDDPSLLLSTVTVESTFQAGQPPAYRCRTGPKGGMVGPYWAVTTIADLPKKDAKK